MRDKYKSYHNAKLTNDAYRYYLRGTSIFNKKSINDYNHLSGIVCVEYYFV